MTTNSAVLSAIETWSSWFFLKSLSADLCCGVRFQPLLRLPWRGVAATVGGQANNTTNAHFSGLQKVDCKKNGRDPTSQLLVNRVPVFLGTGGESGVHPRSLMLLAGDIETNPGPGREIDIMDSLVEHELCCEGEILDSSNDSGRGNTDTSGVDLGLLDTKREDELNESSSLSEEHRGDRTFENCSRVENRSGREGSREKPFENGVSGEIAEINDDDLIVRATCISCNSPFRKQYSPFFCVEPGCLAICHRQEICSGLSRTGQKRGGWRCFLHG